MEDKHENLRNDWKVKKRRLAPKFSKNIFGSLSVEELHWHYIYKHTHTQKILKKPPELK